MFRNTFVQTGKTFVAMPPGSKTTVAAATTLLALATAWLVYAAATASRNAQTSVR